MATFRQHLKLMLWLYLALVGSAIGDDQRSNEEIDSLHRSKRTLTTICVEIKPSGPQEEPYYMCKGADFRGGGGGVQQEQQHHQQQQPLSHPPNAQPVYQPVTPMATFPSFPAFAGGFIPVQPVYEEPRKITQTTTVYQGHPQPQPQPQSQPQNQPQAQSGPIPSGEQYAAPAAPTSSAQSYGMPTVPYPGQGSPSAAAYGIAAGSGPATTPTTHNSAAVKKPQGTNKVPPSKPSNPSYESYDSSSVLGSRYRPGLDEDVLALPNVGFQREELNQAYRQPLGGSQSLVGAVQQQQQPMIWLPQPQAQSQSVLGSPSMSDFHDDPVMRAFYSSLQAPAPAAATAPAAAPQVGAVNQFDSPKHEELFTMPESILGQPPPTSYLPNYGLISGYGGPPTMPPPPPPVYSRPESYSGCNSAPSPPPRQCPTAASESCPSFQPVIIAMPCFGQQPPTHYLAMPNQALTSAGPLHDSLGSPFGFAMSPQVGNPFGINNQMANQFGMSSQSLQSGYQMNGQVGAAYPMASPQVGGPFSILNPFGPLGNLNPFNPFNRLLGSPSPTTPQPTPNPLHRWLGMGRIAETSTTTAPTVLQESSSTTDDQSTSSTMVTPSSVQPDVNVGPALDSEEPSNEDDDEEGEEDDTMIPPTTEAASAEANVAKSLDTSEMTAQQFVDKATDKLKGDKRKRHNHSRSSSSSNSSQKRKYLQQL